MIMSMSIMLVIMAFMLLLINIESFSLSKGFSLSTIVHNKNIYKNKASASVSNFHLKMTVEGT